MEPKDLKVKIIVVFGGVYSSLGKGICTSSIGKILSNLNYKVSILKMDPYLNVDPETMTPSQHGEVYVTADGAQTDLDVGNYERFLNRDLTRFSNLTSGRIYFDIITKERTGGFKGKTVQVIPHVTNYIKEHIYKIIHLENPDFLLIEVGGTIGDIESVPFVESISQLTSEIGAQNLLSCLVSPLIYLNSTSGEIKTKPTQHSLKELRSGGIYPNLLILRSHLKPDTNTITKLAFNSHIEEKAIFLAQDVKSIYDLPKQFYKQKIHEYILHYFNLPCSKKNDQLFLKWTSYTHKINSIENTINIGLVGKYINLHDSYASLIEAIKFAGYINNVKVKLKWIEADELKQKDYSKTFRGIHGVVVPGGFGERGSEEIISIFKYLRIKNIPTLGICLGMQLMVIEFARNVLKLQDANSYEFNKETSNPIIQLIDGDLRLGNQECKIIEKTKASDLYKYPYIMQRHRHRYGLINEEYMKLLEQKGMIVSGISRHYYRNLLIAEIVEVPTNTFYMGCQYHPEFSSRPDDTDPIFCEFIKKSIHKS